MTENRCAACGRLTVGTNHLGIGVCCTRAEPWDATDARIDSVYDEPWLGAFDELDQRHLTETEAST